MTRNIKRYLLIASIIGGAILVAAGLGRLKPPPETRDAENIAMLVQVQTLQESTVEFSVSTQGTVQPRTETVLSSEVSGAIIEVSPKFIPGGIFAANEVLIRIDPSNYEAAVDQGTALVRQRQIEYDGALKLRSQGYRAEAELASAEAALATAKADLVRARRNLERTYIRLPYEGMVRSKDADLGQFVGVGTRLGVTFATDFAEVRLPLTDSDLAFIDLPDAQDIARSGGTTKGPRVTLSAVQRGKVQTWDARIVRSEGVIDERSRVTYAVARIDDPYLRHTESQIGAPLPIGTFVSASIDGTRAENVIRVPRSALRGSDRLMFVDEESRLQVRTVDVLRTDSEYAYLSGGARSGERIIVTAIDAPINGMRVRTGDEPAPGDEESRDGDQLVSGGQESQRP
ncbi:MAG: efflux RND transporter periplasmic adaptor subunit [Woeseiaceae bacterium]